MIRDNVVIDTGATIDRSIIWRNSYIGERVEARGAIIGLQCSIKSRATLAEGTVLSDNTLVGEGAVLQPNVKIWPDKEIQAGATVTTSVIWGSQARRDLFGRWGITGMVNVDLTPEFCTRLGAALGSILRKQAGVTVNREAHNTPRVLKRAILSGLPSAGVNVWDLATQPIPVARFYTRVSGSSGGIHVRLSPYDNRVVDIKFFGDDGLDLSARDQRSIETIFFREDFRRVYLDEIGHISYPADVAELYQKRFMEALELDRWPLSDGFDHIVIDYANATSSLLLPDLLTRLNCDVLAVNTLLDQKRMFRSRPQWEAEMERLGAITQALKANFGVRLDVGGERVFFTSDEGSLIHDLDALIAVARLVFLAFPGATIGVPVTVPRVFERLAAEHGGFVQRLKVGPDAHMQAATTGAFTLVGDGRGSFIFPAFTPFSDGLFAIAKIMELTAKVGQTLSDSWRTRQPYYRRRTSIACPWEEKGRVIRQLREQLREAGDNTEGLSLDMGDEWMLILPDPDEPCFWIYAEGRDAERAQELVETYHALVASLL